MKNNKYYYAPLEDLEAKRALAKTSHNIYDYIYLYFDKNKTWSITINVSDLSKKLGKTKVTVRNSLRQLKESGLFTIQEVNPSVFEVSYNEGKV